jgi:hypothetical protein
MQHLVQLAIEPFLEIDFLGSAFLDQIHILDGGLKVCGE